VSCWNTRDNESTSTPRPIHAKSDVWSIGVMAYILLSGRLPFDAKTKEELSRKIVKGKYRMDGKEWNKVSQAGKALL